MENVDTLSHTKWDGKYHVLDSQVFSGRQGWHAPYVLISSILREGILRSLLSQLLDSILPEDHPSIARIS
jgi:hypothetical protein